MPDSYRSTLIKGGSGDAHHAKTRKNPHPETGRGSLEKFERPFGAQASASAPTARVAFGSTGMPGPMDVLKLTFLR